MCTRAPGMSAARKLSPLIVISIGAFLSIPSDPPTASLPSSEAMLPSILNALPSSECKVILPSCSLSPAVGISVAKPDSAISPDALGFEVVPDSAIFAFTAPLVEAVCVDSKSMKPRLFIDAVIVPASAAVVTAADRDMAV